MSTQSDRIEQYLRNTMTEDEKSAFQFELMQDKNLQEEVKAMRIVQKTVIAESRGKASAGFNYRPLAYAATILLLVGAFFYYNQKKEEIIVDTDPPTEISPNHNNPEDNTTIPSGPEEKDPEVSNPIALADPVDLVSNPLFEKMTTGVRGGDLEMNPISPAKNTVLSWKKEGFVLPFTGKISTKYEATPTLNLLIFSNKKVDYQNWKFLKKEPLIIKPSGIDFNYSARPKLQVKRGLYYYLIENEETEETVFWGRFEVK